jgi:uncharacterized protein (DUF433 family)
MDTHGVSPLGLGLFPLQEAARLARLDVQTARRWAEGYTFRTRSGDTKVSPGILQLAFAPMGRHHDLTFAEMLTLRLVKQFKATGLSLPTIKRVAERAAADFGLPNPLISQRFRTDGQRVFIELQQHPPANDGPRLQRSEREVIDILTGQRQFMDIVEPSFKDLDWEHDSAARWWPLSTNSSVVIDPLVVFGAPHISGTRVPTEPVADAVRAEGGGTTAVAAAADWFGLTEEQVRDAIRFETEWPRRAA